MNERADDDDRDEEADDEPDRNRAEADTARACEQRIVMLHQLQRRRAEHGRDGEEETELGGGAPLDPEREPAEDRRARTADAWNHRQALDEAHANDCL